MQGAPAALMAKSLLKATKKAVAVANGSLPDSTPIPCRYRTTADVEYRFVPVPSRDFIVPESEQFVKYQASSHGMEDYHG